MLKCISRHFFTSAAFLILASTALAQRQATQPTSIQATPGFRVELLRSAQESESSWISLSIDSRGRIFLGLDDLGAAVLESDSASGEYRFRRLSGTEDLRHLRGILYANDSLYLVATDSESLWRCFDRDGDGEFEERNKLLDLPYQSRYGHGANQLVLGPDQMLYLVVGNDVQLPSTASPQSPYRDPREDWLLPNPSDLGQDDRVGYIARLDADATSVTILAGGLRNPFDMAIDREGEWFTWDADMEWDAGLPWYRPTRLNHLIGGGEYGWRWGTGKWPAFFPDSLPSTLDTGLGSPTGMIFGYETNWPDRYRDSLYMADWQHGRIWLVDLEPKGASYSATAQIFLEGTPLNVCDLDIGPDGALYFITGGRGSQSGLYRVTWTGEVSAPEPRRIDPDLASSSMQSRALRRELEQLQQIQDPNQIQTIISALSSDDLWLRFPARVALENQPLEIWSSFPLTLTEPRARQMAALALARKGAGEHLNTVIDSTLSSDWNNLSTDSLVDTLRTLELALIRLGEPDGSRREKLLEQVRRLEAHESFRVAWLASELLVKLKAEDAVERLVAAIAAASTQEEQIQFAKSLMHAEHGWTRESATALVSWLGKAREFRGGRLVETTWQQLRQGIVDRFPPSIREAMAEPLLELDAPRGENGPSIMATREFVELWTVEKVLSMATEEAIADRDSKAGFEVLAAASCLQCHRWQDRGTHTGPELTLVGRRFDTRALLESIITPHAQVDPKYALTTLQLIDGTIVSGRAIGVNDREITIETDAVTGKSMVVPRTDIELSLPATRSPMPEGLLNSFREAEILDLLALLKQGPSESTQ